MKGANYVLSNDVLDYNNVASSGVVNQEDLKTFYNDLNKYIIQLYPASNIDPKLSAETFRVMKLAQQAPGLSNKNKLKRALYPKMFDRVFSIFVNEKDFILHTESIGKSFSDIYKNQDELPVKFPITPEISRPNRVRKIEKPQGAPQNWGTPPREAHPAMKSYSNSTKEGFPTVESYYISVTLLPDNALDE